MKKSVFVLILCILALFVSCGDKPKTDSSGKDFEDSTTIEHSQTNYEIAQIAFLKSVDYSKIREEKPLKTYVYIVPQLHSLFQNSFSFWGQEKSLGILTPEGSSF